jgi:hypothetical protein
MTSNDARPLMKRSTWWPSIRRAPHLGSTDLGLPNSEIAPACLSKLQLPPRYANPPPVYPSAKPRHEHRKGSWTISFLGFARGKGFHVLEDAQTTHSNVPNTATFDRYGAYEGGHQTAPRHVRQTPRTSCAPCAMTGPVPVPACKRILKT